MEDSFAAHLGREGEAADLGTLQMYVVSPTLKRFKGESGKN